MLTDFIALASSLLIIFDAFIQPTTMAEKWSAILIHKSFYKKRCIHQLFLVKRICKNNQPKRERWMRIETILNNCQKFKSFIYSNVNWFDHNGKKCLEVKLLNRKNSHAICSCCNKALLLNPLRLIILEIIGHTC